jgi:hypothetical protein
MCRAVRRAVTSETAAAGVDLAQQSLDDVAPIANPDQRE